MSSDQDNSGESIELNDISNGEIKLPKRRPNLPTLRLDTSNLNTQDNLNDEYQPPPSAILDIAKSDTKGLKDWLNSDFRPPSASISTSSGGRSSSPSFTRHQSYIRPSSSLYHSESHSGDHTPAIQSANTSTIVPDPVPLDGEILIEKTFSGNRDELNPFEESLADYHPASGASSGGANINAPNVSGVGGRYNPHMLSVNSPAARSPGILTPINSRVGSSESSSAARDSFRPTLSPHPSSSSSVGGSGGYSNLPMKILPPKGRTLFYFEDTHPWRIFLSNFFQSPLELTLDIVLTFLQMVMLSLETKTPSELGNHPKDELEPKNPYTLYVFIAIYIWVTLTAIGKCIAFGVFTNRIMTIQSIKRMLLRHLRKVFSPFTPIESVKQQSLEDSQEYANTKLMNTHGQDHVFLRNSWGRIDFVSILCFWASTIALQRKDANSLVFLVSGIGHLRIIKLLLFLPQTRVVLFALKRAIPLLANILLFIGFFLFIWGIIGLQTFNGSLRRACVYDGVLTEQNCGSWLDSQTLQKMPFLIFDIQNSTLRSQDIIKGYTCPVNSVCVEFVAQPNLDTNYLVGGISFDNIFNALEVIFILMSNNSFTPIMYSVIDSEYQVSSLFFIVGVFILGIWLMNLLVAVMVSSYATVRETVQASEGYDLFRRWRWRRQNRKHKNQNRDGDDGGYDMESQRSNYRGGNVYMDNQRSDEHYVDHSGHYVVSNGRYVLESKKLGRIYLLVLPCFAILALTDLIVQAVKTPPKDNLFNWEMTLAVVFTAEIIIRFLLYLPHWRLFFRSYGNIFDILLAIANLIVMIFYHDEITYAWLTIFQLLRVYRVIATVTYVRNFWSIIVGNARAFINLTLFFFGTAFICSLMACKMLRGLLPMETDGELNMYSFYDLAVSYFAMYQVASTENWTDILFYATQNVSRQGNNILTLACIGILFCGWLFFANFLIYNLFIGLMTENLHGSVNNPREEQVKQLVNDYLSRHDPEAPIFDQNSADIEENQVEDLDDIRPVTLRDKLVAFINRKQLIPSSGSKNPTISRKLRNAIERKFVIEFLEQKATGAGKSTEAGAGTATTTGTTAMGTTATGTVTGNKTTGTGTTTVPTAGAPTAPAVGTAVGTNAVGAVRAINDYSKHPVYLKIKHFLQNLLGLLHHFPTDYRKYLHDHLETRRREARARSHTAYVEEMFDYNEQALAILDEYCETNRFFDRPLFIFGRHNKLRVFCQKIFPSSGGVRLSGVYPKKFVDTWVRLFFMIVTIALVIQTCVNTPLSNLDASSNQPKNQSTWTQLHIIDLIYGCVFTLEFLGKVIADGFHFTPNAYTRSLWNCLDFIVLISIWITFINDFFSGPLSRYLRALMALRALRLSTLYRNSEKVFNSIFVSGFPSLFSAALISLSILVPYSVWGKNIFHDRLLQCNDGDVNTLSECLYEYDQMAFNQFQVLAPRVVEEQEYFNYNNFWDAILIQFGVLSLEGWVDVLDAVTSITEVNKQPETYASKGNAAYPMVFHYIGTLFIIGMFIAVIIRNYSISMGTAYLTEDQLAWRDLKRTLKLVKPSPMQPKYMPGTLRFQLLQVIPTWIDSIEKWMLFVTTVCMASYYYPTPLKLNEAFGIIYIITNLVLICTSLIKLYVYKPRLYLHDWWNPFGLVVCSCILGITISNTIDAHEWVDGSARNADRSLFILLLLLWIPRTKRLYQFYIIGTSAISQILKLLWAWFTLFITYAIALNQSFGLTKLGENSTPMRNFRTVPKALIALFTMSCGEGWNEFLIDFTMSEPYCLHGQNDSECGIPGFAYFLFITWNLVSMYVFANLFISLICEACWYVFRKGVITVDPSDLTRFKESWQLFDPRATGFIRTRDIYKLVGKSQGYFSMSIFHQDPRYSVQSILAATNADVNASGDPYDVDMDAINNYLEGMPTTRYKEKKRIYYLFTQHCKLFAQPVPGGSGIPFSKLLLLFPLYKDVNPADSLTLKEFIILKVQLHEVQVRIAADFINRRWRSKIRSKRNLSDSDDAVDNDNDNDNPFNDVNQTGSPPADEQSSFHDTDSFFNETSSSPEGHQDDSIVWVS